MNALPYIIHSLESRKFPDKPAPFLHSTQKAEVPVGYCRLSQKKSCPLLGGVVFYHSSKAPSFCVRRSVFFRCFSKLFKKHHNKLRKKEQKKQEQGSLSVYYKWIVNSYFTKIC